jgi:hypothetical protein
MTPINKEFVVNILQDVTVINFTIMEQMKLKSYLVEGIGNQHINSYINQIYGYLSANFVNPEKIIIIPFVDDKNRPHLNIQKTI